MSGLKRRTFIRNSVIAGIGASITPKILQAKSVEDAPIKIKKLSAAEKKKVLLPVRVLQVYVVDMN